MFQINSSRVFPAWRGTLALFFLVGSYKYKNPVLTSALDPALSSHSRFFLWLLVAIDAILDREPAVASWGTTADFPLHLCKLGQNFVDGPAAGGAGQGTPS